MKLQQPNGGNVYVNLDNTTVQFMGWKKGDEVIIDRDRENDSITITRFSEHLTTGKK